MREQNQPQQVVETDEEKEEGYDDYVVEDDNNIIMSTHNYNYNLGVSEEGGAGSSSLDEIYCKLHQNGLLKGDDLTDRFFRLLTVTFFLHAGYSFPLMTRIVNLISFIVFFFPGTSCCTLLIH